MKRLGQNEWQRRHAYDRPQPEQKKKVKKDAGTASDEERDNRSFNEKVFAYDSKFARFMNALGDVLCIGILWLVTCVPLITIGASTTAAYCVSDIAQAGR